MLKKLFGGKSEGFFLELDDDGNQPTQAQKKSEPKPVAEAPVSEAQPEPVAEAPKPEAQPEPVKAKSSKKTSIKNKKNESTKTVSTVSSKTSSGSSSWEQPSWVKTMYKSSSSNGNGSGAGGEQTFATDYLMPAPSNYRRRPGPSLNKFKEMARQAKTPRR